MKDTTRIRLTLGVLLLAALLAAPAWSQPATPVAAQFFGTLEPLLLRYGWTAEEVGQLAAQGVDWSAAQWRDAEPVALALRYAREQEPGIGPEVRAQVANQIMVMAREMRSLGYGEAQITQAALLGLREALQTRQTTGTQAGSDSGLGDLLRTRLRDQVRLAECDQTQDQLRTREQDRERTTSDGLVAGPPAGAGGPGSGGRP